MQGKLASKMLESEFTPQPIDECLGCLGDALVHQEELSAVISIYAQGMRGAEVSPFPLHATDHLANSSLSAKLKFLCGRKCLALLVTSCSMLLRTMHLPRKC